MFCDAARRALHILGGNRASRDFYLGRFCDAKKELAISLPICYIICYKLACCVQAGYFFAFFLKMSEGPLCETYSFSILFRKARFRLVHA